MDAKESLRRVLRVDSLVVTAAVLVHVLAGGVAAAVMAREGEPDWVLYGLMGLLTAVVLTNYGRLGARATLVRRVVSGLFSIAVVAAWGALLADRISPSTDARGTLGVGIDRPWLLLAVGLEAIVVGLVGFHVVALAPKTRQQAKARQAEARAALQQAKIAREQALAQTGGAGEDAP